MDDPTILVDTLAKTYGTTEALRGIDLRADAGTVLGLLGPNGAGKTTAVRILATLQPATAGTARVAGFDVDQAPKEVRKRIGVSVRAQRSTATCPVERTWSWSAG